MKGILWSLSLTSREIDKILGRRIYPGRLESE